MQLRLNWQLGTLLLGFLANPLLAGSGGSGPGNGGDPLAMQFVLKGRLIVEKLRAIGPHVFYPLSVQDIDNLALAVDNTRIELTNKVLTDPAQGIVTSLVIPDPARPRQKKILLARTFWVEALFGGMISVNRYVLHEYLRVTGKGADDDLYQISSKLDEDTLEYHSDDPDRNANIAVSRLIAGPYVPLPFAPNETDLAAVDSEAFAGYRKAYDRETTQIDSQIPRGLGPGVRLLDIRTRVLSADASCLQDGVERSEACSQDGDTKNLLAKRFESWMQTEISLEITKPYQKVAVAFNRPRLTGALVYFTATPRSTGQEIQDAVKKASASFIDQCSQWKESVSNEYGNSFVFADCGVGQEIRQPAEQFERGRGIYFESVGTIYYLERK